MSNAELMCQYISMANTNGAVGVCEKYGYSVDFNDLNHITYTLLDIIANEDNDAIVRDITNIHPDKGLILSQYNSDKNNRLNACGDCRATKMMQGYNQVPVFNAIGEEKKENTDNKIYSIISNQTNTLLLIGLVGISIAILYKTK